jgi:hypothetical protein
MVNTEFRVMTLRVDCSQHTEKDICGSGMPMKETSTSEIVVLRSKSNCFSVLFHEIPPSSSMVFWNTASGNV